MTPQVSPAATKPHLGQDADQSFFKAWNLRAAARSEDADRLSPLSMPSPKTVSFKRPPLTREYRSLQSQGYRQSPNPRSRPSGSSDDIELNTGTTLLEEPPSKKAKSSTETLSYQTSTPSSISSLSIRTVKLLRIPKRRSSINVTLPDPNELEQKIEARSKRETFSQLFKTKKGGKHSSQDSSRHTISTPTANQQSTPLSGHSLRSPEYVTSDSGSSTRPLIIGRATINELDATSFQSTEGLYCRVKRRLGLKHGPIPGYYIDDVESKERSGTGMMLDQATGMLPNMSGRKTSSSVSASTSNMSIAGTRDRRGGLLGNSASSSLRNFFMNKPHMVTPDSTAYYTGSDNEQYFRVEISSPNSSTFLPSEARRVGTPPLPGSDGSGKSRRMRGFFFEYRPPDPPTTDLLDIPTVNIFATRPTIALQEKEADTDNWFRTTAPAPDFQQAVNKFELDVPDHLPNSPLCPKNPKHPNGGTGICVYHGRRHTDSMPQASMRE